MIVSGLVLGALSDATPCRRDAKTSLPVRAVVAGIGKAGLLYDVTIAFAELRPANRLTPEESLGLSGIVGTTDP